MCNFLSVLSARILGRAHSLRDKLFFSYGISNYLFIWCKLSTKTTTTRLPCYSFGFVFLSDPSPIIGNACHSLTNSCLVNLIDVGLACEYGISKLVEDVDDEKLFTW